MRMTRSEGAARRLVITEYIKSHRGVEVSVVAGAFGVSPRHVANLASKAGLSRWVGWSGLQAAMCRRPANPRRNSDHAVIVELARRNPHLSLRELAALLSCSPEKVRYVLKREGINLIVSSATRKLLRQAAALFGVSGTASKD